MEDGMAARFALARSAEVHGKAFRKLRILYGSSDLKDLRILPGLTEEGMGDVPESRFTHGTDRDTAS